MHFNETIMSLGFFEGQGNGSPVHKIQENLAPLLRIRQEGKKTPQNKTLHSSIRFIQTFTANDQFYNPTLTI